MARSQMTVRELIQALILNCDLDDQVYCEVEDKSLPDPDFNIVSGFPRRVVHFGDDNTALIECHDK